jgi:E3 ubiquitin-protein ligase UBR7
LVGQGPKWYEKLPKRNLPKSTKNGVLAPISEDPAQENGDEEQVDGTHTEQDEDEDVPLPEGFPDEEDFDHLLCYKCVEAHPWIKQYAGTPGFLLPVFLQKADEVLEDAPATKKRKIEEDSTNTDGEPSKRIKSNPETEDEGGSLEAVTSSSSPTNVKEGDTKDATLFEAPECKLTSLPPAPNGIFSLFAKADFRDYICHCPACFPNLKSHPQVLEPEEEYEPPLSDSASANGSTHGSGSLYERGESALKNVDRVRAIEGVMAYNNLKEKLKPFFQQFAESGKAIGAEDIKEYFAKLRGDEQAIKEAGEAAKEDNRKEQSGY